MKLRLLMLGKTRRPEMRAAIDDYVKRISRANPIEVEELRDAGAALKRLDASAMAGVQRGFPGPELGDSGRCPQPASGSIAGIDLVFAAETAKCTDSILREAS